MIYGLSPSHLSPSLLPPAKQPPSPLGKKQPPKGAASLGGGGKERDKAEIVNF